MNTQTAVTKLNFRTHKDQLFTGWGGEQLCHYRGKCVVCGSTVYEFADGSAEPRGPLTEKHAVDWLHAEEYDKAGPDVPLCFDCGNTREKHQCGLAIALKSWGDADACDGECGRSGIITYRLDMFGSGGVFLCAKDWDKEMAFRKLRNKDLDDSVKFDILPFPGDKVTK